MYIIYIIYIIYMYIFIYILIASARPRLEVPPSVQSNQHLSRARAYPPTPPLSLLPANKVEYELEMMEVLKFHLLVHSPLRPMRGLVLQYKTQHPDADCAAFEAAATTLVERWLASDVVLLFPPSQIALAAFVQAAAELNQTAAEKSEEAGAPGGAAAAGAAGASAGGAAAAVDHEGFVKELCGGGCCESRHAACSTWPGASNCCCLAWKRRKGERRACSCGDGDNARRIPSVCLGEQQRESR